MFAKSLLILNWSLLYILLRCKKRASLIYLMTTPFEKISISNSNKSERLRSDSMMMLFRKWNKIVDCWFIPNGCYFNLGQELKSKILAWWCGTGRVKMINHRKFWLFRVWGQFQSLLKPSWDIIDRWNLSWIGWENLKII